MLFVNDFFGNRLVFECLQQDTLKNRVSNFQKFSELS